TEIDKNRYRAEEMAEDRILDILLPPAKNSWGTEEESEKSNSGTRQVFRKKLREGQLDDKEIEVDVAAASVGVEIMA
ncbi:hypothetical protein VST22_26805, partial [Bacillus paranthracis]|nr:hypothetical protein [Bacillus paranthracis]